MSSPTSTHVSERLREAMRTSSVSRYRLAKELGIDESGLNKFFRGERGLSITVLDRLAERLGLELRPRDGSSDDVVGT